MTTEIAKTGNPIQHFGQSLTQQDRLKHRAWIGLRVEALLSNFWRDTPSEAVKEMMLQDWIASLDEFSTEEIMSACRDYIKNNTRKPKPGDIRAICLAGRAAHLRSLPKRRDPEPELSDEELAERRRRAAEIIKDVGFGMKQ